MWAEDDDDDDASSARRPFVMLRRKGDARQPVLYKVFGVFPVTLLFLSSSVPDGYIFSMDPVLRVMLTIA